MVRAPESALVQDLIRIRHEVAIGKEKQLDDLEIDDPHILHRRCQQLRFCRSLARLSWHVGISFPILGQSGNFTQKYVSFIDVFLRRC
jgi:hypothetical protein